MGASQHKTQGPGGEYEGKNGGKREMHLDCSEIQLGFKQVPVRTTGLRLLRGRHIFVNSNLPSKYD